MSMHCKKFGKTDWDILKLRFQYLRLKLNNTWLKFQNLLLQSRLDILRFKIQFHPDIIRLRFKYLFQYLRIKLDIMGINFQIMCFKFKNLLLQFRISYLEFVQGIKWTFGL